MYVCMYLWLLLGKTSLATQFVENQFNESYDPTIENSESLIYYLGGLVRLTLTVSQHGCIKRFYI